MWCIIADDVPSFHPAYSHSILYVGRDLTLLKSLQEELKDCLVARCASGLTARTLIASDIKYLLLLFDEQLPDMTGEALAEFARSLPHRESTPVIVFNESGDFESVARAVKRVLSRQERERPRDGWWSLSRRQRV